MQANQIIKSLRNNGYSIHAHDGFIDIAPANKITPDIAKLITSNKDELINALAIENQETPQQKQRRLKVTKMLADCPHLNHVMLIDDNNPDPDYHIVALAVRDGQGGATSELLIPRAKVDIWQLMEFIQQHGQVKH
jgi:hypothetical protein